MVVTHTSMVFGQKLKILTLEEKDTNFKASLEGVIKLMFLSLAL